jgi:RNA 2',3'-cyclic 3'-phosphodiesterase
VSFFLAIDLDERVREEVWQATSPHHARAAKWLRRDKLHLTLLFLGEPSLEERASLEGRLRPVAGSAAPFTLTLEGAGQFETARAPAVIWLGVAGQREPLFALQRALSQALQLELDRPYVPHVTLARAKAGVLGEVVTALSAFRSSPFEVTHLTFFESTHEHYRAHFQVSLGDATAPAARST